jgi:hypothetical protein
MCGGGVFGSGSAGTPSYHRSSIQNHFQGWISM